jgi:hypothetical protein
MKAIRAEELLDRKISRFDSHFSLQSSSDYSLRQCLGEVRGGEHKDLIEQIRYEQQKQKRDELKSQLPCVSLSGLGNRKGKHDISDPTFHHSGLLQVDLDLDDHAHWEINKMLEVVNNDRHVLASFLSPSGGVKAVVPIEQKIEGHLNCFLSAELYFSKFGLNMCKSTKNLHRLCYLSYDPSPYISDGEVDVFAPLEDATQKHRNTETQKRRNPLEYNLPTSSDRFDIIESIEDNTEAWLLDPSSDITAVSLWREFIYERYEPDFNKRNEVLVNFIKYAHARMSRRSAMILARQIHSHWGILCRADISTHIHCAESLWAGCENTFKSHLTRLELNRYMRLRTDELRDTFRICRDLAIRRKGGTGRFFLSTRNLGLRLGFEHTRAWRNIRKLKDREIIKEVRQGTQGANGSATEFKWMLSP